MSKMFDEQNSADQMSNVRISVAPGDLPSAEGVVAVSQSEATRSRRSVLASGGNSVDATIAVQFALNVVEPGMFGNGGGTFVNYYASGRCRVYSFG